MAKLAINGGNPVRTKPFTQWPQGGKAEMDQLEKVLKAGQWGTLGNEALAFAEKFAQYNGVNYGISVNNGTISLELILRGLNIEYGFNVLGSYCSLCNFFQPSDLLYYDFYKDFICFAYFAINA